MERGRVAVFAAEPVTEGEVEVEPVSVAEGVAEARSVATRDGE